MALSMRQKTMRQRLTHRDRYKNVLIRDLYIYKTEPGNEKSYFLRLGREDGIFYKDPYDPIVWRRDIDGNSDALGEAQDIDSFLDIIYDFYNLKK